MNIKGDKAISYKEFSSLYYWYKVGFSTSHKFSKKLYILVFIIMILRKSQFFSSRALPTMTESNAQTVY